MNLITYFSRVAERGFTTVTEVRDFFIRKEFLEMLGSTDLEFTLSLVSAVETEPGQKLCPDTYNLLKGLPLLAGRSYGNLATRVASARALFLTTPNLKLDAETGEFRISGKSELVEDMIKTRMRHLSNINSYLTNRVLTNIGESYFSMFIIETPTADSRVKIGEIELNADKFLFATLLLCTIKATNREGKSGFSNEQFELLKNSLLRYTRGVIELPSTEKEVLTPRQIDMEIVKYNKASRGHQVADLLPLKEIYQNIFKAIDDSESIKTCSLCVLLGTYRRYSAYKAMFIDN